MLLTRPPLTPKGPFDLHVLGLPPAFALSQDQTLRLNPTPTLQHPDLSKCRDLLLKGLSTRSQNHHAQPLTRPDPMVMVVSSRDRKPVSVVYRQPKGRRRQDTAACVSLSLSTMSKTGTFRDRQAFGAVRREEEGL